MTKEEADEWRARNDGIDVGQLVTNFFGYCEHDQLLSGFYVTVS